MNSELPSLAERAAATALFDTHAPLDYLPVLTAAQVQTMEWAHRLPYIRRAAAALSEASWARHPVSGVMAHRDADCGASAGVRVWRIDGAPCAVSSYELWPDGFAAVHDLP